MILGQKHKLDLQTLLESRLLIQANSGGGKSWILRRILEQTHGKVQHIVLDLEGEFSKEDLGEITGYQPTSGSFNNSLSRLNSLALGQRIPGGMRLHPDIQELL